MEISSWNQEVLKSPTTYWVMVSPCCRSADTSILCPAPLPPHSVWKSKEAWHNINCAFMLIRSYILQPPTWPGRDCQLSCSSGHAKSITYFWTDQAEIVTQVAGKNKNITNESHWSFTSSTYIHANYSAVTVSDSDEIIVMFCIF